MGGHKRAQTVGVVFDLVPAAIFIHVYLAFPRGRLERRLDRALVAAAYFASLVLQLVGLMLGGFGDSDAIAVVDAPGAWRCSRAPACRGT